MDLSILMPTYNHAPYISTAIESVIFEKTDFDWELLIGDDASTDGTLDIALSYEKKFPKKIRVFGHKKNEGLLKNYRGLLENASGKYIAILESDDVWTSAQKVQEQISFMEGHPGCGLCTSFYSVIDADGNVTSVHEKKEDEGLDGDWFGYLLFANFVKSPTIVFRASDYKKYCSIDDYIQRGFKTFDLPLLLDLCGSMNGGAHMVYKNLVSYRILSTSISNSADYKKSLAFEESILQIVEWAEKKYGSRGVWTKKKVFERRYFILVEKALRSGDYGTFKKYAGLLKSDNLKYKAIHFFPRLFYLQHWIRAGLGKRKNG